MDTGEDTYRIDPHRALERMVNGYETYELTEVTIQFTGEVNIEDAEIMARMERF